MTPVARSARLSIFTRLLRDGFGSSVTRCHNKPSEAGQRGNDVCLRKFGRAHKGWTLLKHQTGRSGRGGQVASADFGYRTTSGFSIFSPKTFRDTTEAHSLEIYFRLLLFFPCPGGGSHSGRGTHKCERRALRRLRCKETKLAPHLGCRSHRWKMPTFSPSFSSGKTRVLFQTPPLTLEGHRRSRPQRGGVARS